MENYMLFIFIVFFIIMMFGFGFVLVIKNIIFYGRNGGIKIVLGMVFGMMIYIIMVILGFFVILMKFVMLFILIKYVGVFYLIYLVVKLIKSVFFKKEDMLSLVEINFKDIGMVKSFR